MKALLICGTEHKGSTYRIGRMLLDRLGCTEEDVREIFLPRDLPEPCCGCGLCFMENERKCPHYGYLEPVTAAMEAADLLVFTSPVYVFHVTGQMKSLLDHYGYRWMVHRPAASMFFKQAVCIATAAGAGMKSTIRDMKDSLSFWGVGRIFTYGKAVQAIRWAEVSEAKKQEIGKDMARLARRLKQREGRVTPSLKVKMLFGVMRLVQRRGGFNPADYEYWKSMGWLERKRPWRKDA